MLYYFKQMEVVRRATKRGAISIGDKTIPLGEYVMRLHYKTYHIWSNSGSEICLCCRKVYWNFDHRDWYR